MKEYKRLHIIKHALESYIERPGATEKDLNQEKSVLKETIENIENLKERFDIKSGEVLKDGAIKISTHAINHINDQMVFYKYDGRYTDDGYTFVEIEMCYGVTLKKDIAKAKQIARWFFCDFDEKTKEFTCTDNNELEAITKLIQVATAMSYYTRFKYVGV